MAGKRKYTDRAALARNIEHRFGSPNGNQHRITEEGRAKMAPHWFGSPNGNPQCQQAVATSQRLFYRWCETQATLDELKAYYNDERNPATRRRFVSALLQCDKLHDFFELTDQTHGRPKETLEVQSPDIADAIRDEWRARYGTDDDATE